MTPEVAISMQGHDFRCRGRGRGVKDIIHKTLALTWRGLSARILSVIGDHSSRVRTEAHSE